MAIAAGGAAFASRFINQLPPFIAMHIAGFTIIRNALRNDYPVVEAICSILPVVDEMVVSVGDSDDGTEELIRSIGSPKIRLVHSVWDPALRTGGTVLAVETDKAFRQISPAADWAFYLQADEVVHERYHDAIRQAAAQHLHDPAVEGLLFDYEHFYGTYDYVGASRRWYRHEVRIIRNDPAIHAYRDAQGFRRAGQKLRVQPAQATVYHYGWVKEPRQMRSKMDSLATFWDGGQAPAGPANPAAAFAYEDFDALRYFEGTHPAVMRERVARKNWTVALDVTQTRFTPLKWLLYWVERRTGYRVGEYRNYRLAVPARGGQVPALPRPELV